jgi:hypothetical protein
MAFGRLADGGDVRTSECVFFRRMQKHWNDEDIVTALGNLALIVPAEMEDF